MRSLTQSLACHMLPRFASNNAVNAVCVDAKLACKVGLKFSLTNPLHNFWDVGWSQFWRESMAKSALRQPASFLQAVVSVLLVGAKEKVCRVYTRFVIATMADAQTLINGANEKLISDAMSQPKSAVQSESPVTVTAQRTSKIPASAWMLFDKTQKTLKWWSVVFGIPNLVCLARKFRVVFEAHMQTLTAQVGGVK